MVKQDALPRNQESVGTRYTRRTVARGMAWSVPVVAVAAGAPAFASSQCQPILTLEGSCKCPGKSSDPFTYYLQFCVKDNANCPTPGTFAITSVTKANDPTFAQVPNKCFPDTLATATGTVGGCTTKAVRFVSDNSANFLTVTFTVNGQSYTTQVASPPNCTGVLLAQRCSVC